MGLLNCSILSTRLVFLDSQQSGDLLGFCEACCFDGRVGQEYGDDEANDDRQQPNHEEEDPPAGELAICEAGSISNKPADDLGYAVADIEVRDSSALL